MTKATRDNDRTSANLPVLELLVSDRRCPARYIPPTPHLLGEWPEWCDACNEYAEDYLNVGVREVDAKDVIEYQPRPRREPQDGA
jgi:hypothetical protein